MGLVKSRHRRVCVLVRHYLLFEIIPFNLILAQSESTSAYELMHICSVYARKHLRAYARKHVRAYSRMCTCTVLHFTNVYMHHIMHECAHAYARERTCKCTCSCSCIIYTFTLVYAHDTFGLSLSSRC